MFTNPLWLYLGSCSERSQVMFTYLMHLQSSCLSPTFGKDSSIKYSFLKELSRKLPEFAAVVA